MMNAKARELGLERTHFVRPDGLDAPGHYSSGTRRHDARARSRCAIRAIRATVRDRDDTIPGGRHLHTWNDLLGVFQGLYGVKTGHTGAAGWCEVAAVRRNGVTLYTTVLGSPTRSQRNADLAALLALGHLALPAGRGSCLAGRVYLRGGRRLREERRADRRRSTGCAGRSRRQAARRARRRPDGALAAGRNAASASAKSASTRAGGSSHASR